MSHGMNNLVNIFTLNKMLLSICIPNYNRANCLENCLNSIKIAKKNTKIKFEVCISDNNSEENILSVVKKYKKYFRVKFKKNKKNFGMGKNIISAVSMAKGEFIWVIGNDDLLLPNTLKKLNKIILKNYSLDFFFINSYLLDSNYVFNFEQPFDTKKLPKKMEKFSKNDKSKILNFHDLINPKISFDYLVGLYLSVFRRKKWNENLKVLNKNDLVKPGTFSTFDNTCPHIKIFSKAFATSKAFFCADGLSVNLSGQREWSNFYPFIESIRIPETLDHYFKYGFSMRKYFLYKNHSLKNFLPSLFKIALLGKKGGLYNINIKRNLINNLIFPNFYLSIVYFIFRKIIFFK